MAAVEATAVSPALRSRLNEIVDHSNLNGDQKNAMHSILDPLYKKVYIATCTCIVHCTCIVLHVYLRVCIVLHVYISIATLYKYNYCNCFNYASKMK